MAIQCAYALCCSYLVITMMAQLSLKMLSFLAHAAQAEAISLKLLWTAQRTSDKARAEELPADNMGSG